MHQQVLNNIAKHISLTGDETDYFLSLLNVQSVQKKDFILKEGQRCRYINFVNSGILRAYYEDKSGRESTIMFALQDWWITDMHCFINRHPAMLNIQAVEHSEVLQLERDHLDELFGKVPKFERFFRIILQNAYIREQLRTIQNLSLTAEERYENFITKYPQVAAQVTQKQVASYLGITPEFLSMIRAGKSRKPIS
jgi:CRP-like cAMP-binding protein